MINIEPNLDKTVTFKAKMDKKDIEKIVRTGKLMTHFQLEKRLGEGGMGTVYLGTDITLDRPVAIKFMNLAVIRNSLRMNPQLSENDRSAAVEAMEARFIREAKSAACINHPNLAQIYEANFETDDWYIAMEYVSGDSLAGLIEKDQKFSIGQILTIFKQTVAGLKHAWDNYKIVHRDIKPANIMVTPEGEVKIVDLGLAKPIGGNQELPDVTGGGMPIGTPQYMAPEQARGDDNVDYRTDIFALGATLYELCANKKAFDGNTPAQVYHCQVKKEYKNVLDLRADTPRQLARLIESMMEPKADDRPANYDDLLKKIDLVEDDSSSSLTTLVGLVTKEVRRLQAVDYDRLIPWQPLTSRGFWTNPFTIALVCAGIIPIYLLKDSPRPDRISWAIGMMTATLWGYVFYWYLKPSNTIRGGLLKAMGITACIAMPAAIVLSRMNFSKALFSHDFFGSTSYPAWKLVLTVALVEEVLKLLGVWFLPKFLKRDPSCMDYCTVGVASGLVFSLKSAIVFSILTWDNSYYTHISSVTRFMLLLVVTPLLHACWGGISARFVYLARESKKLQIAPLIMGLGLVSLLHGLWLALPKTPWAVLLGIVSILIFLASITQENELQSVENSSQ